jgi:hypothetical protein
VREAHRIDFEQVAARIAEPRQHVAGERALPGGDAAVGRQHRPRDGEPAGDAGGDRARAVTLADADPVVRKVAGKRGEIMRDDGVGLGGVFAAVHDPIDDLDEVAADEVPAGGDAAADVGAATGVDLRAVLGSVPIGPDGAAGAPRVIDTGGVDDFDLADGGFVVAQFSENMVPGSGFLCFLSCDGRELAVLKRAEIANPSAVAIAREGSALFRAGDVIIVDKERHGVSLFKPDAGWRRWLLAIA